VSSGRWVRSGEGANEGEREFQRFSPAYIQRGCARSTVVFIGRDWMTRAVSGDGVVR
jgi:hypothetical protein